MSEDRDLPEPMAANPECPLYKEARRKGCTLCDEHGHALDGGYFNCPHPEWAQVIYHPELWADWGMIPTETTP